MTKDWSGGGWEIYKGDVLLGTAYFRDTDFPWYICDFKPTPAFDAYRAIFDEYAALVNDPSTDDDIVDFYETRIVSLSLELHPFGGVYEGDVDVVQIFSNTSEAWLRPI